MIMQANYLKDQINLQSIVIIAILMFYYQRGMFMMTTYW